MTCSKLFPFINLNLFHLFNPRPKAGTCGRGDSAGGGGKGDDEEEREPIGPTGHHSGQSCLEFGRQFVQLGQWLDKGASICPDFRCKYCSLTVNRVYSTRYLLVMVRTLVT